MAGVENKNIISFSRRNIQIKNTYITCEIPSKILNSNIGILFDRRLKNSFIGNSTHNKIGLAYNHNFQISDFTQLRLGFQFSHLAATYDNFSSNAQHAHWWTSNDFNLGVALISDNMKFGVSLLNLLQPKIDGRSSWSPLIDEKRNYIITFSYDARLNRKLKLIPSLLINIEEKKYTLTDFSLYLKTKRNLYCGISIRHGKNDQNKTIKDLIGLLGIQLKEKVNFQFSINPIQHEDPSIQTLIQYKF